MTRSPFGRFFQIPGAVFYGSAIVLFLITHLTTNRIDWLLDAWSTNPTLGSVNIRPDLIVMYAPSFKLIGFVIAMLSIITGIVLDLKENVTNISWTTILQALGVGVAAVILLGILVLNPGTESMGNQYARLSLSPFTQKANWFNTRLLMPALAHVFQLKGQWTYYAFSVFLTVLCIALLHIWNKANETGLRFWQIVSLATCSFVIFQFQKGGYPDILVFCFFLLVMQKNSSQNTRLAFLLLALLTHESSVFIGIILAWRYLDRPNLIRFLSLVMVYFIIWFLSARLDIANILTSHNIKDRSGWEWVLRHPIRELLGVLISFKAVWVLGILAILIAIKNHLYRDMVFMLGCLGTGLFMTFMGVDTARMMSFAFPGFLAGIEILAHQLESSKRQALFNSVFLINLLIPSIYIGLVADVEFSPGLYKLIYESLLSLFI